jgi:protein-tyrosine phosphatase
MIRDIIISMSSTLFEYNNTKTLKSNLETYIDKQLDVYESNNTYIDKLQKAYELSSKYRRMTLIITIKNNKLYYEADKGLLDSRKDKYIEIFNKTHEHITKKNKVWPYDTKIYLYISDVYNYEHQDLPFFLIARPSNRKGILIPDDTFRCHVINKKCIDWDTTKNMVNDNCKIKSDELDSKINKIYFRGANTGEDKHNLRKLFEENKDNAYDVTIGSHRIPLYDFCDYKYLLNLPGHQPWSYRFKYLFLMKSLVINVDLRQHYPKSNDPNGRWINLFDTIFVDDIDFINLTYDWYEDNPKINAENYVELIDKIKKIYEHYENNSNDYNKIVQNGYDKAMSLTNEIIYDTLFYTVSKYSQKFNI